MKFFRNRRLYKEFMQMVEERRVGLVQLRELLPTFPNEVVYKIGKAVIFADYDGYNYNSVYQSLCYFENLNRELKEFYIQERFYKLL